MYRMKIKSGRDPIECPVVGNGNYIGVSQFCRYHCIHRGNSSVDGEFKCKAHEAVDKLRIAFDVVGEVMP